MRPIFSQSVDDRQPMFVQPDYRLLTGHIVDQHDKIAVFDLGSGVVAGVDYLCEDVFGVGAHVGGKYNFFMDVGQVGGRQVGYYGAD